MNLKYEEGKIRRLLGQQEDLKDKIGEVKKELAEKQKKYDEEWNKNFWRSLKEARLSWCTFCGAVRDSDYLSIGYDNYWKTDHYDREPHLSSVTRHRACSDCMSQLSTKSGEKGCERDCTQTLPREQTLEELTNRIGLPPRIITLEEEKAKI